MAPYTGGSKIYFTPHLCPCQTSGFMRWKSAFRYSLADVKGSALQEATAKIDEYARGMISGSGSTLFEELGLYYIGPIDGHNLDLIIAMLQGTLMRLKS